VQRLGELGTGSATPNDDTGADDRRNNLHFEPLRQESSAAATGTFTTIQSGSDIVLEESPTFVKTSFPVIPDEMFYNDVGVMGDRLVVRLRNPTAGAIVMRVLVQLTDL
jgi:hypothetical protein